MTDTIYAHNHHGGDGGLFKTSISATLHCLVGCSIGEFLGLAIGVALGLGVVLTMSLAVVLAFVFGIGLAVRPLMKQGFDFTRALQTIWLGEVISIAVMEIAMNATDYAVGGVQVETLADPLFWIGFAAAVPAGFLAAWPVNYWLIGRNLKECH